MTNSREKSKKVGINVLISEKKRIENVVFRGFGHVGRYQLIVTSKQKKLSGEL